MMRYLWLAIASMAILLSTNVMAANKDFSFFVDGNDKLCLSLFKL